MYIQDRTGVVGIMYLDRLFNLDKLRITTIGTEQRDTIQSSDDYTNYQLKQKNYQP